MNESYKDNKFYHFVKTHKTFSQEWYSKKGRNEYITECLSKASKKLTNERGEPDFIYYNENTKMLILLENKNSISFHEADDSNVNIPKYSVNGIKHYLSFFINFHDKNIQEYFKDWKVIGIALSGDIDHKHNHRITTFVIKDKKIEDINKNEILDEESYIALFENYDIETITSVVSSSSKEINNLLRSIDSQKRPILLSALMICLYDKDGDFYKNFNTYKIVTIIDSIKNIVKRVLNDQGIENNKINIFINQLSFIDDDKDLHCSNLNILNKVLVKLKDNVIPLFSTKTHYDIIGKFYADFLRYAGISDVKKGIVLTPYHITKLFTEIIDLKINDIIFDPCCGTGAFLISGMNTILEQIESSSMNNKTNLKNKVKEEQLIGIEKNSTMYCLAISNMLFRGDGKSRIYHDDFFLCEEEFFKDIKPTIGFINPPYGGKDNKENPTKKEIQFLQKLLDVCSRYVIIIAPISTYFKDDTIRENILKYNTLKYVINMPHDLFKPNASTNTAIAVFETRCPHDNKEVIFYNLKDDGFVLSKNKGRTDAYNKWGKIKEDLLHKIKNPEKYIDEINLVKTKISPVDEWILQAHCKSDYSDLTESNFINSIKEYVIFNTKKNLNLLNLDLNELDLLEILNSNNIKFQPD
jgi:type I restriction enzyme M protein